MNKKHLPRLNKEAYRGSAVVHWVFNIEKRKTGWLDKHSSMYFRYLLAHICGRHQIVSPCLCMMPDHIHMLLMGTSKSSDQITAVENIRRFFNQYLAPSYQFQKTPYDHVLRKHERKQEAFRDMVNYILQNPVRAGLVEDVQKWEYSVCVVPGYPEFDVWQEDYWQRFWRLYYHLAEEG